MYSPPLIYDPRLPPPPGLPASGRLVSLDAYRGTVMLLLAASSFGLTPQLIATFYPDSPFWSAAAKQWTHVDLVGCHLWDLIQPAFMFIVGVSVPFSYSKRQLLGESYPRMFGHAVYRAIVLVLLGVFLRSLGAGQTNWTFEDVVSQIGLGYVFLFLLWNRPWQMQAAAAAGILAGYGALWRFWPQVANMLGIEGAVAGWPTAGNPAQAFDVWLRNALPHEKPFVNHAYYTLNFVPSLATMIFGLMCGELLRSDCSAKRKLWLLVGTGVAGVALGAALSAGQSPICPLIKKLWTPSWAIFSGGWCVLLLAAYFGIVDLLGWRRWTFPAVVLGANSIAVYVLIESSVTWLTDIIRTHTGYWLLSGMSPAAADATVGLLGFAIFWGVFYWLYRKRVFLKI